MVKPILLTRALLMLAVPVLSSWIRPPVFASYDIFIKNSGMLKTRREASSQYDVVGLYRPFADQAWAKLKRSGLFTPIALDPELSHNSVPAKGMPENSTVRMEVKAMVPSTEQNSPVHYARYALLETIMPDSNSTEGIQVLNLVVFPSRSSSLPVWGVDLVSLPGGKHLLAMDVQPMSVDFDLTESSWKEWYEQHVANSFAWGGDLPEEAAQFFSEYALWTRLDDATLIHTKLWDAFCQHLDLYVDLLLQHSTREDKSVNNRQQEYLCYRLKNDPARPMLTRLYGKEWTEQVLEKVLFPQ